MNEKKIIIHIIDVDEATALDYVKQCIMTGSNGCYCFIKLGDGRTIEGAEVSIVKNKNSVKYIVRKE